MRELAYIELQSEPPPNPEELMSDQDFEEEARLAGEGRWEELDLDRLPDDWQATTIQELREQDGG